ncbi:MAG: hypothetical protein ORN54_15365, partial [Cyclobacteriaceae bacterium]|nr:hypothetical protein [Cyclobacteriaceae bacterium]
KSTKMSKRSKRLTAALDDEYRSLVLKMLKAISLGQRIINRILIFTRISVFCKLDLMRQTA